jgi:hypothetical protein
MSYKGKINVYSCPAGHTTVTIDTDEGVTPMMLRCTKRAKDGKHDCTEYARSSWYRCDQALTPEYEWYKPASLKGLNRDEKEHVVKGGLLLRKIKPATDAKKG